MEELKKAYHAVVLVRFLSLFFYSSYTLGCFATSNSNMLALLYLDSVMGQKVIALWECLGKI